MRTHHLGSISRLAGLLALSLATGACSESDPGTGVEGGFTLSVSASSISLPAGQQGMLSIAVTRTGDFTGAVSLAAEGLATGITASFSPSSVASGSTSAALSISVASTVAPGSYPFTVRATASGQPDQTRQVTVVVIEAPGFSLSLSNGTLNITQGQNATTTVTVTTTTTFTGSVTLSVGGLPNGVTAAFSQNPVPAVVAAQGTALAVLPSVLTLTVGSGVTAGNYTITVTGTAQGIAPVNSTLALTVTAATVPGFTMSVNPNVLSVDRGTTGQVTVTVTRTGGFTGPVTLSPSGQPLQTTVAFSQNPVTGNSATVTFSVGAGTALGAHTITIQGTATGVGTAQVTITLTVTAPPTGGSVTMQFCGIITPIWLAAQNGNGQWTQIPAGANDTYTFTIDQFGGVAYVELYGNNGYELTIIYASGAELAAFGPTAFCPAATKTVTGMVAGLGATESATISLGGSLGTASAVNPNWTAQGVPPGLQDLLAIRNTLTPPFSITPNAFVLQRGLDIPHQGKRRHDRLHRRPDPLDGHGHHWQRARPDVERAHDVQHPQLPGPANRGLRLPRRDHASHDLRPAESAGRGPAWPDGLGDQCAHLHSIARVVLPDHDRPERDAGGHAGESGGDRRFCRAARPAPHGAAAPRRTTRASGTRGTRSSTR